MKDSDGSGSTCPGTGALEGSWQNLASAGWSPAALGSCRGHAAASLGMASLLGMPLNLLRILQTCTLFHQSVRVGPKIPHS